MVDSARLTLADLEVLVPSGVVRLPVFGKVSEIPWRRSGVSTAALDGSPGDAEVFAACAAAAMHRQRRPDGAVRMGLSSDAEAAEAVPVLLDAATSVTTWAQWVADTTQACARDRRRFGHLGVDDLEHLVGQARGSGRRRLFSVLVDRSAAAEDSRPLANDVTVRLDGPSLRAVYDDRLLDEAVVAGWLDDAVSLLRAAPDELVIDVLRRAEERRLSSVPTVPVEEAPDVVVTFDDVAAASPTSTALVDEGGPVTYAELEALVSSMSARLRAEGVAAADVVAVLAFPGRHFVAALLGVLHCGAAPAVLDLQSPTTRLVAGLRASTSTILLVDTAALDIARPVTDEIHGLRILAVEPPDDWPTTDHLAPVAVAPSEPGYVLLTSGSTGTPKAVVQTRRTLSSIVDWQIERSGRAKSPRTLQRSALSFDVALQEILSTIGSGGCLEILPDAARGDFAAMAEFIEERRVERVFLPPSGLHALLVAASTEQLSSLTEVVCAGEALTVSAAVRLAFRSVGARLDNHYGPTETHVCLASWVEGDPFTWPDRPPIGRPLPGVACRVQDPEGRPLPIGAVGELVVTGRTVALGYLGSPSERFDVVDIDGVAVGRYRTGDLVRRQPNGDFEFLGREDDQVKVRGYRIEFGDVEAAAMATGLVSAAGCGILRTRGADRLVLAAVASGPAGKAQLLSALATRLPGYMVPRPAEVAFVDHLPTTTSGKLDRAQLVSAVEERLEGALDDRRDGRPARDLWLKCLGVDDCGADDTFIGLGGDSLAAVELSAVLDDALGMKVPLRSILDGMTLAKLEALEHSRGGSDLPTAPAEHEGLLAAEEVGLVGQEFPKLGQVWALSAAEARHLYLDVVICSTYGQYGFLDGPLDTVVDIGANIGMFSLEVLRRHPDAEIIAIEPHPGLLAALHRNIGARSTVIEAAAGDWTGRAALSVYPAMPAMSSLVPDIEYDHGLMEQLLANEAARAGAAPSRSALRHHVGTTGHLEQVEVDVVRLSEVLEARSVERVSLLKIDVQHGERQVLAGIDDGWWPKVDKVVVEVQDADNGVHATATLLESKGFDVRVHQDDVIHHGTPVHYLFASRP